ncbi:hypothetical protein, partial [Porphyromonas sp. COT-290 OH860]|uniref:hypothetical protein n=1 Tax=Porphyromonas sp. COT-290 OH860 TaxID=1515615 RepID=UPI0005C52549
CKDRAKLYYKPNITAKYFYYTPLKHKQNNKYQTIRTEEKFAEKPHTTATRAKYSTQISQRAGRLQTKEQG